MPGHARSEQIQSTETHDGKDLIKDKALKLPWAAVGLALCGIALGWAGTDTHAQSFPIKPIRLIVPYSAGGGADATARLFTAGVSEGLGSQLVVENRSGAGGRIGAELVARASPDGYTLLLVTTIFPVSVSLGSNLRYDPEKDFTAVTLLVKTPSIFAVHPSLPVNSIRELIALAKANPGKINYAGGIGSTLQLFTELFKVAAKIDMLHVPYNGTGPALIGVLSGEAAVIVVPGALVPYVRSGRLRALAITSPQRSQALPDLPTVAESGLPGFEATQWYGVMAPAGTPDNVVARLNSEFVRVVRTPQMKALLIKDASIPIGSAPGELAAHLKDEIAKWAQVVKLARIRVD